MRACHSLVLVAPLAAALFLGVLPPAPGAAAATGAIGERAPAATAEADPRAEFIRSHYVKFEYRVPMRDGVRLFTSVYVPRDRSRRHPILMLRTPYNVGPYGADRYPSRLAPTEAFERSGFVFVHQDVRGRFMSEGVFEHMRPHLGKARRPGDIDESTDTWDTIAWLIEHVEGHNGKVGMWGISYPGFYCTAGMIDAHPALVAVSPQAPIADWFWDDLHRHGAFALPMAFFLGAMGAPRSGPTTEWPKPFDFGTNDGYRFYMELGPVRNVNERYFKRSVSFWNDVAAHPNYDAFWQARSILPHLKGIRPAVLVVGGWYDNEDLYGPLETYRAIERLTPRNRSTLVMGPWAHGGWERMRGDQLGDLTFGWPTSDSFQDEVVLPFFLHHLGGGPDPHLPEAYAFETGANRWRRFDTWPPAGLERRRLYLRADGALAFDPAPGGTPTDHDAFPSDPRKPVPNAARMTPYWSKTFLAEDQRFSATRPDVLVYETPPLEDDVTLAGTLTANLWVSTTAQDADWVVKVIDVWPGFVPGKPKSAEPWRAPPDEGGQQALVRAEAIRGRFRDSYERPTPFVSGQIAKVSLRLLDVLHTFQRGHRIMVHIQSSWFPYIDRNPQKWVPNIFEATEADFVMATHSVYRSPAYPSHVEVGVLRAADAPARK